MIRKDEHKPTRLLPGRYRSGPDIKLHRYGIVRLACVSASRSDKLLSTEHVVGQGLLPVIHCRTGIPACPIFKSDRQECLSYLFAL
jgi:hypothetical protein